MRNELRKKRRFVKLATDIRAGYTVQRLGWAENLYILVATNGRTLKFFEVGDQFYFFDRDEYVPYSSIQMTIEDLRTEVQKLIMSDS